MRYSTGFLLAFVGVFASCGLGGAGVERFGSPDALLARQWSPRSFGPLTDIDGESAGVLEEDGGLYASIPDGDEADEEDGEWPLDDRQPSWDFPLISESSLLERWPAQRTESFGRLPGEFQHQAALLLGCRELLSVAPEVLVGIVEAACGRIPIVGLVSDDENRDLVLSTLESHRLPTDSVFLVDVPHDTMWIRDYGPVVTTTSDGSEIVLDADYGSEDRKADDEVPGAIARLLGVPCIRIPVEADGGNLLTNGEGLCLSTVQLLVENDIPGSRLRQTLKIYYGCDQTVFLEPLVGEDTGHIDMFATFSSPDTVVVGEYADDVDAENARVLDRNVEKLSRVETARGRLHVVRIPMPARHEEQWRTYTNVVYANGTLLVPVYSDDAPRVRRSVLETFSRLLPTWDVIAIEADALTVGGGALHCVSRNVAFLGGLGGLAPSECQYDDLGESEWASNGDCDPAPGYVPWGSADEER